MTAAGGTATLSPDGRYSARPDVAIVVFGEEPYAEFVGDRRTLEFSPGDKSHVELMRRLRADNIPVVAVFLSGRPMWVNPELNAADAFVAAFLPGSEGGGVADVLFANADGSARHDFRGRLSYSWPRRADQTALNPGDANYDPLFAYGYGLSYAADGELPTLSEDRPAGGVFEEGVLFVRGTLPPGLSFQVEQGGVTLQPVDHRAQEDARRFTWSGGRTSAAALVATPPLDISRQATGELSLVFDYRVDAAPTESVVVGMGCGNTCGYAVPVTGALRGAPAGEWQTLTVPLRCFARGGVTMDQVVQSADHLDPRSAFPLRLGCAPRQRGGEPGSVRPAVTDLEPGPSSSRFVAHCSSGVDMTIALAGKPMSQPQARTVSIIGEVRISNFELFVAVGRDGGNVNDG